MTPTQLIDQLAGCQHHWNKQLPLIHAQHAYYVTIAEFGYHFFSSLLKTPQQTWLDRFFIILEKALTEGDPECQNLVVVGLFESLQGQNYRQGAPELIEARLLPHSLKAWSDLIEGWTGQGVRTIAKWRGLE